MYDDNDNVDEGEMMRTTTITQMVTIGECRATVYDTEGIRVTGL